MTRGWPWLSILVAAALLPGLFTFVVMWVLVPDAEGDTQARAMRGFANMWFAGRAALWDPGLIFDATAYGDALRAAFGPDFFRHSWGYPPSMLLVAAPFGALPMLPAFLLWTALGFVAFALAARSAGGPGVPAGVALAALFSPALLENALSGQTGALAGALLVAGLLGAATRPRSSGLMLGVLAVKPQMGLLVPVHLLAARRWRTLGWGAVSCLGMAALSLSIWGMESWSAFLSSSGSKVSGVLSAPFQALPSQTNFTSPFMAARALGAGLAFAWVIQGIVSLACVAVCIAASSRLRGLEDPESRRVAVALVIALDLLAVPYSHNYDLPALALATALVWRYGTVRGTAVPAEKAILAFAWFWPGAMVLFPVFVPALAALSPILGAASIAAVAVVAGLHCRRAARRLPAAPEVP